MILERSFAFPKTSRLRSRRDFKVIERYGSRIAGRFLVITVRQGKGSTPRLGITASTRFGISVERNRFKRQLREAFRLCAHRLPAGVELNIRPRTLAKGGTSADFLKELVCLVRRQSKEFADVRDTQSGTTPSS